MMDGSSYEPVLTPPAVRTTRSGLADVVAAAVIEFLTGALVHNPHRVGKPVQPQQLLPLEYDEDGGLTITIAPEAPPAPRPATGCPAQPRAPSR